MALFGVVGIVKRASVRIGLRQRRVRRRSGRRSLGGLLRSIGPIIPRAELARDHRCRHPKPVRVTTRAIARATHSLALALVQHDPLAARAAGVRVNRRVVIGLQKELGDVLGTQRACAVGREPARCTARRIRGRIGGSWRATRSASESRQIVSAFGAYRALSKIARAFASSERVQRRA